MAVGDPTGADLASGTTNGNTLPEWLSSWEDREVSLGAGIELTNGVTYAIVSRAPDAAPNDTVYWAMNPSGAYAGGSAYGSGDSGSTWSAEAAEDNWFQTKASAVVKDSYTDTSGFDNNGADDVDWVAQTFTASSTYTITSVVLRLARWPGSSPGTVTVGIRATVGAPTKATTPAPSDAATDVTLDQATITWVDGGNADTFNVYYGDTSGNLTKVSDAQAGVSFTVTGITLGSPYAYIVTRYWRIDSTNTAGTTTGDEWSFTTIRIDPPTKTYIYHATGQRYYLLVQSDGSYGDPPGTGVENTDYVFLAAGYEFNAISTNRKLVSCANSKIWIEDI